MKAYLLTTGSAFGLLTLVHIWRAAVESWHLMREPFFLGVTVLAAVLCAWAFRLLRVAAPQR